MSGMLWFGILAVFVGVGFMVALGLSIWLDGRRRRVRIRREYEGLGLRVGFVSLGKNKKDKEG